MTTAEIKAIMQEIIDEGEYSTVAIRTQDQPFELGRIDHCSKVWVDGEETDDELDGISASTIDGADMHADDYSPFRGHYYGEHCAIICGDERTWGEDAYEVIINDPVVVRIIK